MRRLRAGVLVIGQVLFAAFAWQSAEGAPQVMRAHYIDVGQGLAVLLEFPCGAVLVDCGAQDAASVEHLGSYVADFFRRRTDLNDTLDAVIISHAHVDHTRAIRKLTQVCRVAHYVDGGKLTGSGGHDMRWIRSKVNSGELNFPIRVVRDSEVRGLSSRRGLSDGNIDPINCGDINPRIRLLSGSLTSNPGWSDQEFGNFSLVVRVDFGESSFLFTGDTQERGLERILNFYAGTDILDADVYTVGHHGSHNATTSELLAAVSPDIAVMGVGDWQFGEQGGRFTTFAYGHPRKNIVDLLAAAISGSRSDPKVVKVFTGVRTPEDYTVRRRIYATGWDGDVVVRADSEGEMRVDLHPTTWRAQSNSDSALSPAPFDSIAGMRLDAYDINMPAYDSVIDEPAPTTAAVAVHRCPPTCRPTGPTTRRHLFGFLRCRPLFRCRR